MEMGQNYLTIVFMLDILEAPFLTFIPNARVNILAYESDFFWCTFLQRDITESQ